MSPMCLRGVQCVLNQITEITDNDNENRIRSKNKNDNDNDNENRIRS